MTAPSAPTPPDGGRALRCPNCGAGLTVIEADRYGDWGGPNVTRIECDQDCSAWDKDGRPIPFREEPSR